MDGIVSKLQGFCRAEDDFDWRIKDLGVQVIKRI